MSDTETIRAAITRALGRNRDEALAALDRLVGRLQAAEEELAEYRSECAVLTSERAAAEGRLQAAEQERDEAKEALRVVWTSRAAVKQAEARVVTLETALREIRDARGNRDQLLWIKARADVALSVSPAPTLTPLDIHAACDVHPDEIIWPDSGCAKCAVSPAPQERP